MWRQQFWYDTVLRQWCDAPKCVHNVVSQATFLWPWQHFFSQKDAIILWMAWILIRRITLSCRIRFILQDYAIFNSVESCFGYLPGPQTGTTFLHQCQCHEVHQHLCRPGDHAKQGILAGLFCEAHSLRTKLSNKKRIMIKGHVCGEIWRWSRGPCGGGTSNISDSTCQHDVDSMLTQATSCPHTVNIFWLGEYRIRHLGVSDMLHGTFYLFFKHRSRIRWDARVH